MKQYFKRLVYYFFEKKKNSLRASDPTSQERASGFNKLVVSVI